MISSHRARRRRASARWPPVVGARVLRDQRPVDEQRQQREERRTGCVPASRGRPARPPPAARSAPASPAPPRPGVAPRPPLPAAPGAAASPPRRTAAPAPGRAGPRRPRPTPRRRASRAAQQPGHGVAAHGEGDEQDHQVGALPVERAEPAARRCVRRADAAFMRFMPSSKSVAPKVSWRTHLVFITPGCVRHDDPRRVAVVGRERRAVDVQRQQRARVADLVGAQGDRAEGAGELHRLHEHARRVRVGGRPARPGRAAARPPSAGSPSTSPPRRRSAAPSGAAASRWSWPRVSRSGPAVARGAPAASPRRCPAAGCAPTGRGLVDREAVRARSRGRGRAGRAAPSRAAGRRCSARRSPRTARASRAPTMPSAPRRDIVGCAGCVDDQAAVVRRFGPGAGGRGAQFGAEVAAAQCPYGLRQPQRHVRERARR